MNKESFGNFIKELRVKKKYTQKELADLLYVDVSTVSKWERGVSYPDITLIPDICKYLNVNEHELIKCSYDLEYHRIQEEGIKFINIKNKVFWTMTFLYIISLVICFIVNISVNHTLSWFFIVFSSLLVAYSFFPSIMRLFKKNKLIWYIGTTFGSLMVLFITISIYTSNFWFPIAIVGTLLGYFLIFYPIVYMKKFVYLKDDYDRRRKYFLISYSVGLVLLTLLLLIVINLYKSFDINTALIITLYSYLILIIYGLIRLINTNKCIRLSIDFFLTSIYFIGLGKVLTSLLGSPDDYGYKINFYDWKNYTNGNVCFIIFSSLVITSIILLICGISKKDKK